MSRAHPILDLDDAVIWTLEDVHGDPAPPQARGDWIELGPMAALIFMAPSVPDVSWAFRIDPTTIDYDSWQGRYPPSDVLVVPTIRNTITADHYAGGSAIEFASGAEGDPLVGAFGPSLQMHPLAFREYGWWTLTVIKRQVHPGSLAIAKLQPLYTASLQVIAWAR